MTRAQLKQIELDLKSRQLSVKPFVGSGAASSSTDVVAHQDHADWWASEWESWKGWSTWSGKADENNMETRNKWQDSATQEDEAPWDNHPPKKFGRVVAEQDEDMWVEEN